MKELVHFNGNNISFSAAVSRVAEALGPLAALRGVVASIDPSKHSQKQSPQ